MKLKAAGASFGYGYNLALSAPPNDPPMNVSRVLAPSTLALLADAAQINTWQPPASKANPMLEEWDYIDDGKTQPNGHFRHNQRGNALFVDGHVTLERFAPNSIDQRMPDQFVGRYRRELLVVEK